MNYIKRLKSDREMATRALSRINSRIDDLINLEKNSGNLSPGVKQIIETLTPLRNEAENTVAELSGVKPESPLAQLSVEQPAKRQRGRPRKYGPHTYARVPDPVNGQSTQNVWRIDDRHVLVMLEIAN